MPQAFATRATIAIGVRQRFATSLRQENASRHSGLMPVSRCLTVRVEIGSSWIGILGFLNEYSR